jgi:shikimate kinase
LGCSIRDYFEREGEESFRDVEESVIDELTCLASGVLSTGGGSVLRPANRQRLRERGHVVYLRSSPEELFRRLRHDVNRPLLQVADPLARLRDLYAHRDPLYQETAHFVIETGRPSVSTLVNMIITQLELAGIVPAAP